MKQKHRTCRPFDNKIQAVWLEKLRFTPTPSSTLGGESATRGDSEEEETDADGGREERASCASPPVHRSLRDDVHMMSAEREEEVIRVLAYFNLEMTGNEGV